MLVSICRRTLIFIILVLLACLLWVCVVVTAGFFGGCFIHCRYHSKRFSCLYATVTSNEANEQQSVKTKTGARKERWLLIYFSFFFLSLFFICIPNFVTFRQLWIYWTRKLRFSKSFILLLLFIFIYDFRMRWKCSVFD